MSRKHLKALLSISYVVVLFFGMSGLLPGAASQAYADTTVYDPLGDSTGASPNRLGAPPIECGFSPPDPDGRIGVELVRLTSNSTVVPPADGGGPQDITPGTPPQTEPWPTIVPGETVTIQVRLRNTDPAVLTFTDVEGEIVINDGLGAAFGVTPTWTNWTSGVEGTLGPGDTVDGEITYAARAVDPVSVNYVFYGWGTYDGGDTICDRSTASNNALQFRVTGPDLTVDLVASDVPEGETITWQLTITNNRALTTVIDSVDDLYFEGGTCSPAPSDDLIDLLSTTTLNGIGDTATAAFQCTMLPEYPDPLTNTVTVDATAQGISQAFEDSATIRKQRASISVTKEADVTQAGVGDMITYTIRVENDGDVDLHNVTVVDTLTGLVLGVPNELAAGESYQTTVDYTVQEEDPDPLINIVTAIGVSPTSAVVSDSWTASVDKRNPALEVVMSATPEAALVGEQITYTIEVTNTGPQELVGLNVALPLCASAVSGCVGTSVVMDGGVSSLPANGSATGIVVYELQPGDPDPFGYTPDTTVTATAQTLEGATVIDSTSTYVDILSSEIRVTKTANRESAQRGDVITYTISVENLTGSTITLTSIDDSLLGSVGTLPQTLQPQDGAATDDDIYEFTVQYTVTGNDPDPLINIVDVVAEGGSITDSTSELVDISNAQLFITVASDPPDEQQRGEVIDYSVGIANVGRVTLTEITGSYQVVGRPDTLPLAIDFPGPAGPTEDPGTLAPFENAFAVFDITVAEEDEDPLTVIVRVQGRDENDQIQQFIGTATIDILPDQLQLNKSADALFAAVGDTVTYTFTLENVTGTYGDPQTITGIQVIDPLCAAAGVVSGCDTGNVVLMDDGEGGGPAPTVTLDDGETATGTLTYVVQASDLNLPDSLLVNTAEAEGTLLDDGEPTGDSSFWELEIGLPIEIEKTADRLAATDGQVVTYTYTITNTGQSEITNLAVADNQLNLDPGDENGDGDFAVRRRTSLAVGAIWTFDVTYTVQYPGDAPAIANTATVTGVANGQTVSASDDWELEVVPPLAGEKTGPAIAIIGDTITYRVDILNVSDSDLTITSAYDTSNSALSPGPTDLRDDLMLPEHPDYVLSPGESAFVEYTYTVGAGDPDELTNVFTVETSEAGAFYADHTVQVFSPFSIVKTPDTGFALIGQDVHYDYLVYNISTMEMTNVVVVDDQLGQIAVRRHDLGGAYTTAPQTLPAAPESPCLPPLCDPYYLESDPAENNYTVVPADLLAGSLVNVVRVQGNEPGGVLIITEEEAEVLVGSPLAVVKIGPPVADIGDNVRYSVTLTNISPTDAITNITALDSLTGEVGLAFPTAPGTLNPGESATGEVRLTIPPTASDPFINTITAQGRIEIDGETYDLVSLGSAAIDLTEPPLEVTLTAPSDEALRGAPINWQVTLTNNSTVLIEDLSYTDSTGADIATLSNCPDSIAGRPSEGDPPVTINCEWIYVTDDDDPDPLQNTLTVFGTTPGDIVVAAEDDFTVDLTDPRFRVSKTADPSITFEGETVTYTITVTNSSGETMTGIAADDALTGPVPLIFPGPEGVLDNGEAAVGTVTYQISQADESPLFNTVTASGQTVPGGVVLSDSTYTTVLISASQLLVEKSVTPTVAQVGDYVTYNIAITNIGQTTIRNITAIDEAVGLDSSVAPDVCGGPIDYDGDTIDDYDLTCTVLTELTADQLYPFEVAFLSYRIQIGSDMPDPFINTLLASGLDPENQTIQGNDTLALDIITPGVSLTKSADRAAAGIGDTIRYTVQVTNTGDSNMTDIVVTDNVTSGDVIIYYEGSPTTILEPGQTGVGEIYYTVDETTPNPFVNTITLTAETGSGPITDGAAATVEIRSLGLSVVKLADVASARIGDTITYTINITNTSNQTLTAVTATDQLSDLPVVLTFPEDLGTPDGVLAPGEQATGTFEYIVPPNAPDPLPNRVTATGRAPSGVTISASGLAFVDVRSDDISITKTATNGSQTGDNITALYGDAITYTIVVENTGPTQLTDVQVTDPLCQTADSGCAGNQVLFIFPGESVPSTTGVLEAGETVTGTVVRTTQPSDPDPLINTATATGRTQAGLDIQDSDSVTVQLAASELVITKTVAGIGDNCVTAIPGNIAQVGETVAYTIRVENTAAVSTIIENISVIDTITGEDLTAQLFPGVTPPDTPTLGPGGFAETCITTEITETTPDPLENTVVATGSIRPAGPVVSDTSSATVLIFGGELLVTNIPNTTAAPIGTTVEYTVTIANRSASTLTNIEASSPEAGGVIPLGVTTLNPGQTVTTTYTHQLSGFDADPFASTVTVTATAPGPVTLTDYATATVDIVSPGVRITKLASPTLAAVGDEITYTITITNTGSDPITDFTVTDMLLGGDITGCFNPAVPLPDPTPNCTPPGISPLPLASGAGITSIITRELTSDDGDPAVNVAAVEATTAGGTLVDTSTASVSIAGSGITVTKRANVAAAEDGDTIIYTLEILNTSLSTVSNLNATDSLEPLITLPTTSLAPGERLTTEYTYTVDTGVVSDPLENTVIVNGIDGVSQPVSDTASATVAILDNANIRVTITPDRSTTLATQTINYLITVTNIGAEQLDNLELLADTPDGATTVLIDGASGTTLEPGRSIIRTFSYTVDVTDFSPVVTAVTAAGTGATAGLVTDTSSASVDITRASLRVDLRTTGCGSPCVGVPGDTINFTATVFNEGAITLYNLTLDSDLPITMGETTTIPFLAAGESDAFTFSYQVPLGVSDPLNVEVEAAGVDAVNTPVTYSAAYILDTASPRIQVELSADRILAPVGDTITYTAVITNTGNEPLSSISAIDSLFGNVSDQLPQTTIDPGEENAITFTYTHTIQEGDGDPVVNTLTVSSVTEFGRSVVDNDTISLNVQIPELFITIAANRGIAQVGNNITYTVTIVNIGEGPISNVQGSYTPAQPEVGGGLQSPNAQGGAVIISLPFGGTLAEGATTTGSFGHVVTSGDANPLTFRVTISGDGLVNGQPVAVTTDRIISIPLSTVDEFGNPIVVGTPIPGVADPEVTKDTEQPFAAPGGLVTWTVNVRNPGTEPLSGIVITDTLTSNMTLESATITNGTIESEGNVIVATTGILQFNESAVLTIIARVDEDMEAGGFIQNIGCATSVGGATSTCDTATIRISPDADLLPATGISAPDTTDHTRRHVESLIALLVVIGLLGMAAQPPNSRSRLIVIAVVVIAAVIIVGLVAAQVFNLGGTEESAEATATAQPGAPETPPAVVEGDTPTEPTASGEEAATGIPPTAVPIPSAEADVTPLPSLEPTTPPPFQPRYERELFIPALNLGFSVPIVNLPLRNSTWDVRDLGQNIGFLEGTTWIDDAASEIGGNTVLAGHIQITDDVPGPFRDLDLLEIGDSIFIADARLGVITEFQITEIGIVAPDDVGVTYPTREQMLTLLTCTTWDTHRGVFAERLVVRASPVRSMSY